MSVDSLDPCGVYFGTTGGQVYGSVDAGDKWKPIVRDLPAVLSVEVQTLELSKSQFTGPKSQISFPMIKSQIHELSVPTIFTLGIWNLFGTWDLRLGSLFIQ